jgi:hypothetical protein
VLRITNFCICIYVLGCKLSGFRLCNSGFGITAVDDITIGITCTAFCFHIVHMSWASYWYLFCLSAIVLTRLCVFGTAMSIRKVFFVLLFMKVISVLLRGYCFVCKYAAIPVQLEIVILQYIGWCVLIVWTFVFNQFNKILLKCIISYQNISYVLRTSLNELSGPNAQKC